MRLLVRFRAHARAAEDMPGVPAGMGRGEVANDERRRADAGWRVTGSPREGGRGGEEGEAASGASQDSLDVARQGLRRQVRFDSVTARPCPSFWGRIDLVSFVGASVQGTGLPDAAFLRNFIAIRALLRYYVACNDHVTMSCESCVSA